MVTDFTVVKFGSENGIAELDVEDGERSLGRQRSSPALDIREGRGGGSAVESELGGDALGSFGEGIASFREELG